MKPHILGGLESMDFSTSHLSNFKLCGVEILYCQYPKPGLALICYGDWSRWEVQFSYQELGISHASTDWEHGYWPEDLCVWLPLISIPKLGTLLSHLQPHLAATSDQSPNIHGESAKLSQQSVALGANLNHQHPPKQEVGLSARQGGTPSRWRVYFMENPNRNLGWWRGVPPMTSWKPPAGVARIRNRWMRQERQRGHLEQGAARADRDLDHHFKELMHFRIRIYWKILEICPYSGLK